MTTLFVPGIAGDAVAIESAYVDMRRRTELDMGRRPNSRRILRVQEVLGRSAYSVLEFDA